MPKKPQPFAYLIAIRKPDETDHIYAILAKTKDEAIELAAVREPGGPTPRHVGALGTRAVERIGLKVGEARKI